MSMDRVFLPLRGGGVPPPPPPVGVWSASGGSSVFRCYQGLMAGVYGLTRVAQSVSEEVESVNEFLEALNEILLLAQTWWAKSSSRTSGDLADSETVKGRKILKLSDVERAKLTAFLKKYQVSIVQDSREKGYEFPFDKGKDDTSGFLSENVVQVKSSLERYNTEHQIIIESLQSYQSMNVSNQQFSLEKVRLLYQTAYEILKTVCERL